LHRLAGGAVVGTRTIKTDAIGDAVGVRVGTDAV
jgi:hypothetical protein